MPSSGASSNSAAVPVLIRDPGSAQALLSALSSAGTHLVLLLGHGQSIKPRALPELAQAAQSAPLCWCPASAHPDCELGHQGRWLVAQQRPPFGSGSRDDASAWGLLGRADLLAESLTRALAWLRQGEDWHSVFRVELAASGLHPIPLEPA